VRALPVSSPRNSSSPSTPCARRRSWTFSTKWGRGAPQVPSRTDLDQGTDVEVDQPGRLQEGRHAACDGEINPHRACVRRVGLSQPLPGRQRRIAQ
jgi:hypothetical protein